MKSVAQVVEQQDDFSCKSVVRLHSDFQQPVRVVFENNKFFNISRPSAEGHLRTMPTAGSCFIEAVFRLP